jgi:hypothetical protein
MSNQGYFPHSEAESISWIVHFCDKLPVQGPIVGISEEEITTTIAELMHYVWLVQNWYISTQQFALEATAHKLSMAMDESAGTPPLPMPVVFENPPPPFPAGILVRLFKLVKRIKNSTNYTESIGQDLGLIGINKIDTHVYPKANLIIKRDANGELVEVGFKKYHHPAVLIETRRNNGNWEYLGVALISPWLDNRPLQTPSVPEIREYRLCWYENNKISGDFSPIQKITVGH